MCKLVKQLTDKENFSQDWELKKQIKSSSGSAMDCIAEGRERGSNNEFIYFLGIAKGSSGEVRSQTYRALDWDYITEAERLGQPGMADRCCHTRLQNYLNSTPSKGNGQRYSKPKKNERHQIDNDVDPNFPSEPPLTK